MPSMSFQTSHSWRLKRSVLRPARTTLTLKSERALSPPLSLLPSVERRTSKGRDRPFLHPLLGLRVCESALSAAVVVGFAPNNQSR